MTTPRAFYRSRCRIDQGLIASRTKQSHDDDAGLGAHHQPLLTDRDLTYVMDALGTHVARRAALVASIRDDAEIREAVLSDLRLFDAVMDDDAVLVRVSAQLFFSILLFRARAELARSSFTIERTGDEQLAIFDSGLVTEFMHRRGMIDYLLTVLISFVRIEHWHYVREQSDGTQARRRVSSFDLNGLITYCSALIESERFDAYRKIGDLCLFVAGMIGADRARGMPLSVWESHGAEFYSLAARHRDARETRLGPTLQSLSDGFALAMKPLRLMSANYLGSLRDYLVAQ